MKRKLSLIMVTIALAGGLVWAQRTAREAEQNLAPTPEWKNDPEFEKDTFTFARVKYSVDGRYGWGHTDPRRRWAIDFPHCDLNISYRLQQMTSLKVDPNGLVVELTEKDLADQPFIYIVEPGKLTFEEAEIPVLRRYLLNGGFLLADDFWGDRDWFNFAEQLKLVFPEKEPQDLALDHPIFHSIFDLDERPQVPGIQWGNRGMNYEARDPGSEEVHYRGIFDDKGRMMVLLCHNTDLGDGWEREGDNETYFHRFSEKKAYPMGINIVFYAMTH